MPGTREASSQPLERATKEPTQAVAQGFRWRGLRSLSASTDGASLLDPTCQLGIKIALPD